MAIIELPPSESTTCIGGEHNTMVGYDNPLGLTTGQGCVAIGYPNLNCPAFGSGCEIIQGPWGTNPKNILIGKPI